MRWMVCIAICLCCAIGMAGVDVGAATAVFQQEHPQAGLHVNGDRLTRVFGPTLSVGDSPEAAAAAFIRDHAEVLGVNAGDLEPGNYFNDVLVQPVMIDPETGDFKFMLVYYRQKQSGIPVYQADLRLLVRNVEGFPLVLAASNLRNLGDFTAPAAAALGDPGELGHVQAAKAAVELTVFNQDGTFIDIMAPVNFTPSEYVIWAGAADEVIEPRLALTFVGDNGLEGSSEFGKWRFVADAASGEILHTESLVIFEDVVGSVRGLATVGPRAGQCDPELETPLPYTYVDIQGGSSAYADVGGDFTISNGGTSTVTVESWLRGLYFRVFNDAGADAYLTRTVTPPGPAHFLHNSSNGEFTRAEVNGYLQANTVRDFALTQNSNYPTIWQQTNFPVYVNLTSGYCPGNAWYDGSSINFCREASGYANTAFSSVVHHEYGHHLVNVGGSGQGEYGEGMADCMSALILDEPKLGIGFYVSDCNNGIRTADNDCQYLVSGCSTCGSTIHACGQLLSGAVWSTRVELEATNPGEGLALVSNLAVNSILLHGGTSITNSITIDFLTLDDTDGNIYNGTPHAVEICAGFGDHGLDCPPITFEPIGFTYPDGSPGFVPPNVPTSFAVHVIPLTGTPVPGTGQLHYRLDGGSWVTEDMTQGAANEYEAVLPGVGCDHYYEWYVSAEAAGYGTVTDPSGAPSASFYVPVASGLLIAMEDDFETNQGWTVQNSGLTDGAWERGIPVNCNRGDPPSDFDGSGQCYLTDNSSADACNSDVDGGYTWLISPTIDLSAGDAEVSYALWYTNYYGADPNNDLFKIYVSKDNGSTWTLVETVGPSTSGGWNVHTFLVGDYVTPSAQVKVRFEASDLNSGSVVEAGIDDFVVSAMYCDDIEDCNGNGTPDDDDLANCDGSPWCSDCNNNGVLDVCDIAG
ncbi:MAG: choice-of-anchor J domain-containing protein, partial [Planctomycetota bacterium]